MTGGLVTGFRAGMAVPDWPNSFSYNMFLYPLAKMTGGVFYEHAHRLLGSLVGLTSLTLAILVSIHRRSYGALILIWLVGFCVLLQGVMGGLRVTDNSPELAVVHGFFAHVILAGMIGVTVLLAATNNGTIPKDDEPIALPGETDVFLTTLLVLAVLGQTLLGTLVRQMDFGLIIHLSMAMLVAMLAMVTGMRLWRLYPHIAVFARWGLVLIGIVIVQLILGGIALAFRTPAAAAASPSAERLLRAKCLATGHPCDPDDGPPNHGRSIAGGRRNPGVLDMAIEWQPGEGRAGPKRPTIGSTRR